MKEKDRHDAERLPFPALSLRFSKVIWKGLVPTRGTSTFGSVLVLLVGTRNEAWRSKKLKGLVPGIGHQERVFEESIHHHE